MTDVQANPDEPAAPLAIRANKPDQDRFPDLQQLQETVLRDSNKVRKVARHTVIRDRHSGEIHHDALTIKTWRKDKEECTIDPDHTITLTGETDDEIQKLITFLLAVRNRTDMDGSGNFLVLDAKAVPDPEALQKLIGRISATGKADAFASVVKAATDDKQVFDAILERASQDPQLFAGAAAALNLAAYKAAVGELEALIATPGVKESKFQTLLEKYPWMFGSEYSELLDRRKWTRDENQDFVVRRTTDGYVELIEIKTPLEGENLFNYDASHDSYYPAAELSKVLGQVQRYIEKLDASRDSIRANDKEDTHKVRAKVVIGRSGDAKQCHALRTLNGHLHRIEVITFDQLLSIARRVIAYLDSALKHASDF